MDRLKYKSILILGAPGSGKGTIGRTLGSVPRFFHFACGDVFRSLDTRTDLGREFVKYSSRGELVPDELTIKLWRVQIRNNIHSHTFKPDIDFLVLDGIPRNIEQAHIMDQYMDMAILLHLSCPKREELKRRIRKRAIKQNRIDDANEEVIEKRLRAYEEETKKLLEYYDNEQIIDIDAMRSPIEVLGDVCQQITNHKAWTDFQKKP